MKGNVKSSAVAVSLIKGLSGKSTSSKLRLISEDISETLGIDAAVLMGANLAPEVANDNVRFIKNIRSVSEFVLKNSFYPLFLPRIELFCSK